MIIAVETMSELEILKDSVMHILYIIGNSGEEHVIADDHNTIVAVDSAVSWQDAEKCRELLLKLK